MEAVYLEKFQALRDRGYSFNWTTAGSLLFLAVSFTVFGLAGDWLYCKHVTGILEAHGCRDRSPVLHLFYI